MNNHKINQDKRYLSSSSLMMIAIILTAIITRLYGLEIQSLWNDELSSWVRSSYDSLSKVIAIGVVPDVHPPGYQILMYYAQKFIGDTPYILRLPSALAGILSIWVIYLLGKKLYSRSEGLVASILLLFSYPAVYYSQEARAYSLLILFSILSTYYHVSVFGKLSKFNGQLPYGKMLGYLISACIASYLHYFGLLLVFCQGIFSAVYVLRNRYGWATFVVMYILLFLAYLPWLPAFFSQLGGGDIWIKAPEVDAFYDFIKFAFNGTPGVFWLFILTMGFLFVSRRGEIKLFRFQWQTVYLLSWLFVPFVLAYIKSITSSPILSDRNLLIILPALLLLVARLIYSAPCQPKTRLTISIVLCSVFFLRTFVDKAYYTTPEKQQFREMASYVVEKEKGYINKPLIIGFAHNKSYLDYYFDYFDAGLKVDLKAKYRMGGSNISISSLDSDRVWVIGGHLLPDRDFLDKMKTDYVLISSQKFIDASAYLFKRRESP